jgi:phosphatidylserine/phosphatidylglycerophosphate/cardiolipin synthase-like enzyme
VAVRVQLKRPLPHSLKIAVGTVVIFAGAALLTRLVGEGDNLNTGQQKHWQVYFSPGGGCTDAIVQRLASAKSSVFVQAYSFTSVPIAGALIDAKKRGVTVSVILDQGQQSEPGSQANFLRNADIRTLVYVHGTDHNKVMVIDDETVITGSFNFTGAAETRNAENLLIIDDKTLAKRYTEDWYVDADRARP